MMNLHLIYIPFSGVGLHGGFRGDKWFRHRVDIFKRFTLKSLANQTSKNFAIWCSFRPEEATNPLIDELAKAIGETGLKYVFTFNGLMYHDDKFSTYTLKTKLRNLLQMIWDGYNTGEWKSPREMWRYTWENKNTSLLARLTASIGELTRVFSSRYEWVYLTRIDSDDMFHKNVVELIQTHQPAYKKALVFDKGYMYNVMTGQLGEWLPPTNPPFHTIVFPGYAFFTPYLHKEYYGAFRSHEDITKEFNSVTLDMHKYCVTFHNKHISTSWDVPVPKRLYQRIKYGYCYTTSGRNISTHWQSRLRKKKNFMIGEEITDPTDKAAILSDFGIYADTGTKEQLA